jgi:hypothetical protein
MTFSIGKNMQAKKLPTEYASEETPNSTMEQKKRVGSEMQAKNMLPF